MLMVVATVGGTLIGCNRQQEATVEPSSAWVDPGCNPAEDCNELFESSTIRQHSEAAASYTELPEGCPYLPHEVPAVETLVDSTIPEFNAGRNRASNMNRGNQRLQDVDLHQHLMGVQGQIFACVDLAACYEDGSRLSGGGDLDFDFELSPNGRVAAVSVQPSPGLDHPSVVACARQAMYDYRFPSYDGGQMMIEYRMTIEEVDEEA
ncbi:MAG: hypothetical protein AAF799_30855 [Myxococcota bacterium]